MQIRKPSRLAIALLTSALSGCFSSRQISPELSGGAVDALGTFAISSANIDQKNFLPTMCANGSPSFFLGADFTAKSSKFVLRFVIDPLQGPTIRVFDPTATYERSVVFPNSECSVFSYSFDPTNINIDGIDDYRISLAIECAAPNGDSIRGKVSTTHCH